MNARRTQRVTPEIRQKAVEEGIDVLLLQEPYSRAGKITQLGLETRVVQHDDGQPWAAVAVLNPEIMVTKLTHLYNPYFAIAELRGRGLGRLYVASGYFRPSQLIEGHLEHLARVLAELGGEELLICLDSNARSPFWGSRRIDTRGETLEGFIAQWSLSVVNKEGSLATVLNEVGEGSIDVTLVTADLGLRVIDWEVREDFTSSDHRTIMMRIEGERVVPTYEPTKGFVISKAGWKRFTFLRDVWGAYHRVQLNLETPALKESYSS